MPRPEAPQAHTCPAVGPLHDAKQLTDEQVRRIHEMLMRLPQDQRNARVFRSTAAMVFMEEQLPSAPPGEVDAKVVIASGNFDHNDFVRKFVERASALGLTA